MSQMFVTVVVWVGGVIFFPRGWVERYWKGPELTMMATSDERMERYIFRRNVAMEFSKKPESSVYFSFN